MKYSWIFIIYFSEYFYVMQLKTIVKLGAGMGAGREGQIMPENVCFILTMKVWLFWGVNVTYMTSEFLSTDKKI